MPQGTRVDAIHGTICDLTGEKFGYFGWPSVARTDSGRMYAVASGLRWGHVCPWGKTVLFTSEDGGATWSRPRVVNDTPLDDRDAGIISLGGEKVLLTWFTSDTKNIADVEHAPEEIRDEWRAAIDAIPDSVRAKWRGSWVRTSVDGEAWSDFIRAPVNTPHGPIRLASGDLLYFGKQWWMPGMGDPMEHVGDMRAAISRDDGYTWKELGSVPLPPEVSPKNLHEPHVVEASSGRLIAMIRYEHSGDAKAYESFSLVQSESDDGGKTWSEAHHTGVYGSPPHMIRHSSGAIVCVYGYRREPFGQRAMISRDDGQTWQSDLIIRDDGPVGDLGYPGSVELPDGRIYTVYYQKPAKDVKNCALMFSIWRLPEA